MLAFFGTTWKWIVRKSIKFRYFRKSILYTSLNWLFFIFHRCNYPSTTPHNIFGKFFNWKTGNPPVFSPIRIRNFPKSLKNPDKYWIYPPMYVIKMVQNVSKCPIIWISFIIYPLDTVWLTSDLGFSRPQPSFGPTLANLFYLFYISFTTLLKTSVTTRLWMLDHFMIFCAKFMARKSTSFNFSILNI